MPCIVCDSHKYEMLFECDSGKFIFLKCDECGFTWAEPNKSISLTDYTEYGEYIVEFNVRLEMLKLSLFYSRLLSRMQKKFGASLTLLDLGAGGGLFVRFCKERGVNAVGVEPSKRLRDYAEQVLGIKLLSSVQDVASASIDVVSTFDVIEHIAPQEHRAFMSEVSRVLRPGGLFFGKTPNICSLNIRLVGQKDPVIWPPSHISYFSPYSIKKYLESCGFKVNTVYTQGFSSLRVDKASYSFVERPRGLMYIPGIILKVLIILFGRCLRLTSLGYNVHFEAVK